jgi:hypothetical protein
MAKRENPIPRSQVPLMAPNMQSEVQRTINEHPEIDTMNEEARGEIIDITDWRINGGIETPWGRKARNNDHNNPNLNTDGMTYLRPDGLFEIYDCISGIDGQSSWEGYGPYYQGENGYWWPPQPVEGAAVPPPVTEPDDSRIDALEAQVAALSGQVNALQESLNHLADTVANGLHTHGPVDLPIVLESLTRLRAKGDINVAVKVGKAEPPTAYEQEQEADVSTIKRILGGK